MEFLINATQINSSNQINYMACINRLQPGERLLVNLPSSIQLANIIIAAYSKGLVTVPVDPKLSKSRLDFIFAHSESSAALFPDGIIKLCDKPNAPSHSKLRFIMYTSGSTGNPKGVMLSKHAVEHNAMMLAELHSFKDGHATCLPLFHCNALMMSLMGCYLTQSKLLLCERFDPFAYFEAIKAHSIRTASIVPALLHELVKAAPKWPDCLQYLITAAAPLSQQLAKDFFARYGGRLRQGYGLTEAVNFSFKMPYLDDATFYHQYVEQYPAVGVAIPETTFRLVDGEVQVKGPNLMDGYWKNDEITSQTFTQDGWLKTGDIGELRDDLLILKGRKKEIINRGGETIYPIDIEQSWENCGLQKPFAALGIENNILEEDIGLWVEHNDFNKIVTLGEKSGYYPAAAHFGPLMVTATRKVQRKKMGEYLFSYNELKHSYDHVNSKLLLLAKNILNCCSTSNDKLSEFLFSQARQVLNHEHDFETSIDYQLKAQLYEAQLISVIDFVADNLKLLSKLPLSSIRYAINSSLSLTQSLQNAWPLCIYATMIAQFLKKWCISENGQNILEFMIDTEDNKLDLPVTINAYASLSIKQLNQLFSLNLSIDQLMSELRIETNKDIICANNSLHYITDKLIALKFIQQMLKADGILVIAEANKNITRNGMPWALNMIYSIYDGILPIDQLQNRIDWLTLFKQTGFSQYGYATMRCGHYDLGGILWAKK